MMRWIAALACAATLAVAAGCSHDPAADYTEGKRLLAAPAGDASVAAGLLRRAAAAGHAPAAWRLGLLLRIGAPGVAADPIEARRLMGQAAAAEIPQAQFALGQMLLSGEGGPRDTTAARHWLEAAAEHELGEAHMALALLAKGGELGLSAEEGQRHLMEAEHALKHAPVGAP